MMPITITSQAPLLSGSASDYCRTFIRSDQALARLAGDPGFCKEEVATQRHALARPVPRERGPGNVLGDLVGATCFSSGRWHMAVQF